jgi:hypothetical protein
MMTLEQVNEIDLTSKDVGRLGDERELELARVSTELRCFSQGAHLCLAQYHTSVSAHLCPDAKRLPSQTAEPSWDAGLGCWPLVKKHR